MGTTHDDDLVFEEKIVFSPKPSEAREKDILLLDPRPVRHKERIQDLFYVLFKRNKNG